MMDARRMQEAMDEHLCTHSRRYEPRDESPPRGDGEDPLPPFAFIPFARLEADLKPPEYVVDQVLERDALIVVFGDSCWLPRYLTAPLPDYFVSV